MYRAARLLGVPPWELEDREDFWLEKALVFSAAETEAQNILTKRAAQRHGKR